MPQKSGIVNKDNYQIDLHNGKILMYIHQMIILIQFNHLYLYLYLMILLN